MIFRIKEALMPLMDLSNTTICIYFLYYGSSSYEKSRYPHGLTPSEWLDTEGCGGVVYPCIEVCSLVTMCGQIFLYRKLDCLWLS